MKKLSKCIIEEYMYSSEDERTVHVECMERQGYECTGQLRRTDEPLSSKNAEYYWYAKFIKYCNN